jgi:hypothetical protein
MSPAWWPVVVIGYAASLLATAAIVNATVKDPYMVICLEILTAHLPCITWQNLGRDLSHTTGTAILQRRLLDLGSYDHHSSRAVSVTEDLFFCAPVLTWLFFSSYLFSSSILTPISQWLQQDLCTTAILRGTNIIFATGILVVLSKLLKVLHPGTDSMRLSLYALALGSFPVSLFYTFLYYTDTGSTFFVLLSFLLAKQRRYLSSGLVRYGVHHIMLSCTPSWVI